MDGLETALNLLPGRFHSACRKLGAGTEELRLRVGRPLGVVMAGKEYFVQEEALRTEELTRVFERATDASLHTAAHALSRGYISYRGLRIGVCGTAVIQDGSFTGFRTVRSLAVRIPHECRGICDGVYKELFVDGFHSTLLLSPPGGGKTTALRELIRLLSNAGSRVSVADERSEISGEDLYGASFDLGSHSDVMTGCQKADASMMLLRGMNPQIIAMDEITHPEDMTAVLEIAGCGVGVLATIHANGPEDLARRPLYRKLLEEHLFERYVQIRIKNGERIYVTGDLQA